MHELVSGRKHYVFRKYFETSPEFVELARSKGIEPTRAIDNDGSVVVAEVGEDGESRRAIVIPPIAPRKRNTPYDAPDLARDEFAQWVADTLSAAVKP